MRITVQLIDVATGSYLWSEAYERNLEDIFAIQSDVALKIIGAMKAEFDLDARQAIGTGRTENLQAYTEYVRGLALGAEMPCRLTEGLDAFQKAIDLDPEFSDALAAKAMFHGVVLQSQPVPQYTAGLRQTADPIEREAYTPDVEAYHLRSAKQLAQRALESDPGQRFAHIALHFAAATEWRWDEA